MTENQIEYRVERMMDHLDRLLLGGQIDQRTYDLAVQDLDRWAKEKASLSFSTGVAFQTQPEGEPK